ERNLHDGTQQRLIALGLDIAALRASVPEGQGDLDANLERPEGEVDEVLGEVRELSRGLHPGLLSRQGLGPSLRALARRSALPISLEVDLPERPPEPVETATYFVVSEALTNAVKYAQASYLTVSISVDESNLHATISDDGVGGAEPGAGAGSGLIGLVDRVNALGGQFQLESPPGGGTAISIELPLAQHNAERALLGAGAGLNGGVNPARSMVLLRNSLDRRFWIPRRDAAARRRAGGAQARGHARRGGCRHSRRLRRRRGG